MTVAKVAFLDQYLFLVLLARAKLAAHTAVTMAV